MPSPAAARRRIVSFVSPSYLGLERHPEVSDAVCRAVRTFGVTTATPRALLRDPLTRTLEEALARWVNRPAALVFASARHAALDVLPLLAGQRGALLVDRRAYPTSIHGASEAQRRGATVSLFAHNDVGAATYLLRQSSGPTLIVIDGVYVAGGDLAPLKSYAKAAERHDAIVFMDDSHGLGVLGVRGLRPSVYGEGGGGLFRYAGSPDRVIVAGTLTKALGAPLAFVAGEHEIIDRVSRAAESFTHDSPPSIPNVAAALAALEVARREGDHLRVRLARLVARFRDGVHRIAAGAHPPFALVPNGPVPIQTLRAVAATGLVAALARAGIVAAPQLRPPDCPRSAVVRFFLTARHTEADVDRTIEVLATFTSADRAATATCAVRRRSEAASAPSPPARLGTPHRTSRTTGGDAS
jgi:8-amino-7-oxononanoate synthase